jgi:hypothetical protein
MRELKVGFYIPLIWYMPVPWNNSNRGLIVLAFAQRYMCNNLKKESKNKDL